jgi:hypothetical protein
MIGSTRRAASRPANFGVASALFAGGNYLADRFDMAEVNDAVASLQLTWLDGLENHCCMTYRQGIALAAAISALRKTLPRMS